MVGSIITYQLLVIREDFLCSTKKISSHYGIPLIIIYNIILCCRLGQGAQALNKAIDSGDTDLIYHVILTLQVITSGKNCLAHLPLAD